EPAAAKPEPGPRAGHFEGRALDELPDADAAHGHPEVLARHVGRREALGAQPHHAPRLVALQHAQIAKPRALEPRRPERTLDIAHANLALPPGFVVVRAVLDLADAVIDRIRPHLRRALEAPAAGRGVEDKGRPALVKQDA